MQNSTADSVTTAVVSEEPPPPTKNVRVGRRGVAAGLTAGALYLILVTYAWGTEWAPHESVAFGRNILTLGMLAGLGVALYGYGMHKSDRGVAVARVEAEQARFDREQWELAQFDSLHDADRELAVGLRQVAETQEDTRQELRDLRESTEASRREMRAMRRLLAEHDLRAGPRRVRRRRQRTARPGKPDLRAVPDPDNVTRLPSAEVRRAARRLLDRVEGIREDKREDKS